MTSWCDFTEQTITETGRPDVTVRLPGNKVAFIDSKAPMIIYENVQDPNITDERQLAELRKKHAVAVKNHIDALARNSYHQTEIRRFHIDVSSHRTISIDCYD